MPPHNDPAPEAIKLTINRRQMLEGFGALAATVACSGSEAPSNNTPATGGSSGSFAGSASGPAAAPSTAAGTGGGGASAGASGPSAGTSSQLEAGHGGTAGGPQSSSAGASGGGAGPGGTGPTGAGAGGQTGAAGATGAAGTAGAAGTTGAAGAGGAGGDTLVPPAWTDVPVTAMCKQVSATDAAGQGPFFIHELEKSDDESLIRQDIRGRYNESAAAGVEMHLHLRLLDTTADDCPDKPLEGVDVYIWHTDAQGFYSGFGKRGTSDEQKPDTKYAGTPNSMNLENTDRFCRGVQTTDANGVVSFRSIFPGWYNGRALHIHFVAFKKGSMSAGRVDYTDNNSGGTWLFTTQFYFDTAFAKSIHEKNDPYKSRTTISAYNDALAANENGNSKLHFTASLSGDTDGVGGIVTAQMQLTLDPKTDGHAK